ncbi:EVE domain-containing protein [Phenylobacterium sp.]|jgi:predicted RNA-binding protein with PUA-like domain|uniref:EVE domain-containing protein n=1 Tax=Phenylobacterium sp. TaxID=1871053 RepID=UPI002E2F7ABE|nr:EVE domain-containing protein [Phenylobacterium sp.]HEX2558726.1 EVE domain-containing protein [Phenylobacterium sp.]
MAASHWLVKSEPDTYSYADLTRDGRTVWDGVRNNAAALHLKGMRPGDEVLVYHSGDEKAVVGVAKVVREAFPDPSDEAGRFVAVELAAERALKRPVTLAQLKAEPALANLAILRQSRLSVAPVSDEDWRRILDMAGG